MDREMNMTVIRDSSGHIINIGPWDYQIEEGEVTNPLPEGAYEDVAEIVTGWDGGLYEASDPRRIHPNDRG